MSNETDKPSVTAMVSGRETTMRTESAKYT